LSHISSDYLLGGIGDFVWKLGLVELVLSPHGMFGMLKILVVIMEVGWILAWVQEHPPYIHALIFLIICDWILEVFHLHHAMILRGDNSRKVK